MTPKEKAEYLVERYEYEGKNLLDLSFGSEEEAKRCALICVDELLKSTFVQNNAYNYWTEVKQEINKI